MTKTEFLEKIKTGLANIPQADREEALDFCREAIEDRVEDGMTEAEAVESLGSVDELVAAIVKDMPVVTDTAEAEKPLNVSKKESVFEQVHRVHIESIDANITIADAENGIAHAECEGDPETKYRIEFIKGCLKIEQETPRKNSIFNGFRFFEARKYSQHIYVYLPQGEYKKVEIESKSGDVDMKNSSQFENVRITVESGDVDIKCNTQTAYVLATSGNLSVSDSKHETFRIITTSGDINISNAEIKSLFQTCTSGNIDADKSNFEVVKLSCTSGDICLNEIKGNSAVLLCASGDINVSNSAIVITQFDVSCGDITVSNTTVEKSAVMKTSCGDISVKKLTVSEHTGFVTYHGNIDAFALDTGTLEAISDFGDITVKLRRAMNIKASSCEGDVEVSGSDPDGGECKIETSCGDIRVEVK